VRTTSRIITSISPSHRRSFDTRYTERTPELGRAANLTSVRLPVRKLPGFVAASRRTPGHRVVHAIAFIYVDCEETSWQNIKIAKKCDRIGPPVLAASAPLATPSVG
jgi:hypothetical protein